MKSGNSQNNSSVKSGTDCKDGSFVKVLGGLPGEKDVKEINKANTTKKAPRSVRV